MNTTASDVITKQKDDLKNNVYTNDLVLIETSNNIELLNLHPIQDFHDDKIFYGIDLGNKFQRVIVNDGIIIQEDVPFKSSINPIKIPIKNCFPMNLISKNVEEYYSNPFDIYNSVRKYFQTYIFFTDEIHYDLITLWCIGTYIFRSFPAYPYIHLHAERNSGKTTLLNLLEPICFKGLILSQMTKPILYRLVHHAIPTLLIDEAECFSRDKKYEDKSGIIELLKSGYTKTGNTALMDDDKKTPLVLSTYCPKIFGSINSLDDVLRDRTITIPMMRPSQFEKKNRYYADDPKVRNNQINLSAHLYLFGLKFTSDINQYYKLIETDNYFEDIFNRQYELWGPLLAIAQLIEEYSSGIEISSPLLKFAQNTLADNELRDETENIVNAIALELYKIVVGESLPAFRDRGDVVIIPTQILYQHLIKIEVLDTRYDKGSLSKLLNARGLAKSISTGNIRYYHIHKENVRTFVKRYSVTESMRIDYDNNIRL